MVEFTASLRRSIHWLADSDNIPIKIADWLMEPGSMTRRFEQHCQQVTVQPTYEGFVSRAQLTATECDQLPDSSRYWLREIVLSGDCQPWLLGRTVLPEATLTGPDAALVDLGTVPLGRYLFSGDNLTRDYIQIGQQIAPHPRDKQQHYWARRSRLRLSGKPLLLTELFLTSCPLYWTTNNTYPQ